MKQQSFWINLNDSGLNNVIVLKVDFPIGAVQFNNHTDSTLKLFRNQISVGVGNQIADYKVSAYTFAQLPFPAQDTAITISFTTPTKPFDALRIDLLEAQIPLFFQTNSPTDGVGVAQNVALTNAIPAGTNYIGTVGLKQLNTDIDFAQNGAKITGETLSAGGSGVLGWLSEVAARISGNLKLSSLPSGSNVIGKVDINSNVPIPTGSNVIGKVDINSAGAATTAEAGNLGAGGSGILGWLSQLYSGLKNLVLAAKTPTILTVTCVTANTEYSIALPANTRKFIVGNADFDSGNIVSIYFASAAATVFKIKGDQYYNEDNVMLAGQTLYFKNTVANRVIQVIAWV